MVGTHLHRAFPACVDRRAGPTLVGSRTVSWRLLLPNGAAGGAAVGWGRKLHFNAIFHANRPSGAKPEGGRLDPSCSSRCAARTMRIDHPAAPFAPRARRER